MSKEKHVSWLNDRLQDDNKIFEWGAYQKYWPR